MSDLSTPASRPPPAGRAPVNQHPARRPAGPGGGQLRTRTAIFGRRRAQLRTPISELRALAEVSLKFPDSPEAARPFEDVLSAATQMESLVTTLLTLSRCEAGRQPVSIQPLDLERAVHDAWSPFEAGARERQLTVKGASHVPDATVLCDRALLTAMLANLSRTPSPTARKPAKSAGRSTRTPRDSRCPSSMPAPLCLPPIFRISSSRSGARTPLARTALIAGWGSAWSRRSLVSAAHASASICPLPSRFGRGWCFRLRLPRSHQASPYDASVN